MFFDTAGRFSDIKMELAEFVVVYTLSGMPQAVISGRSLFLTSALLLISSLVLQWGLTMVAREIGRSYFTRSSMI
jgi:hypothetical protein